MNASTNEVLSEGEQTAVGLAGLLTEVEFDPTKSAVIFDDPISSLDHMRRGIVSRRIVELGRERQVIVFTHDLVFFENITSIAKELSVTCTELCITRNDSGEPGFIPKDLPWKVQAVKTRMGSLNDELQLIKKMSQHSKDSKDYEDATCEWAGKASTTWERIIRNNIVYKVVDRSSTEVKPSLFRILGRITEEDNNDFQVGYKQLSAWITRHDISEEVNYIPPSFEDMQDEYNRMAQFLKKINKYAQP